MAKEIERKFLVTGEGWRDRAEGSRGLRQGYLALTDKLAVRVRILDDAEALLTFKSAAPGTTRAEYEYPIPLADARELLTLATGLVIEKRRHRVPLDGLTWEVDVFEGAHAGLVIAEIELPTEDTPFTRPGWLGREVTADRRYYNASLAVARPEEGAGQG